MLTFDPATRELQITASVSAEVSVTEEASSTVDARVSGTVEADGEGVYYDDGWGGFTAQTAQRDAERNASVAIEEALRRRREQATREADAAAGGAPEQEAAARADAAFAAASARREDELRRVAADHLTAVGVAARALFNAALAEAYRDAILAYARSRRASNLHHSERDGVLDIEFELEV
jgi:hypothetical protein